MSLLPGLPAYILFMMLRHMDHVDDEPKMHQLMKAFRNGVKKVLKKRADSVINLLERQVERLIVGAILEYEEISGLSGPARAPPSPPGAGPARLKQQLAQAHATLRAHHNSAPLTVSIFKQLFYYICAYSLNQLLLRKDLCCWAKGLQIRYNISHLETWIKEQLAEYGQKSVEEILSVLKPITQAVQLLQARKSMADILNMYTPAEEYEVKVTREFIHEIQKKMQEKAAPNADKEPVSIVKFNYIGKLTYSYFSL
ncbi:hypothetical protein MSG28_015159 [Choristoneura fumiferana]|uniref:Uncharacterized protein n=1 Tax=Choristoneura fumiferana TaxID=7141 RepID=A0ACC0KYZ9_CHOFU|nr:hypothetical protein MSG28_015159 [Choristoneura fumiferana]